VDVPAPASAVPVPVALPSAGSIPMGGSTMGGSQAKGPVLPEYSGRVPAAGTFLTSLTLVSLGSAHRTDLLVCGSL
jgi:hypothetical protein